MSNPSPCRCQITKTKTLPLPGYEETLAAPLAKYTVLSMSFNDYDSYNIGDESLWSDRYLGCVWCQTSGSVPTRCPFAMDNVVRPMWKFEDGTEIFDHPLLHELGK